MTYPTLAYVHLATVLPCLPVGIYLLSRAKGTPLHRRLGRLYAVLMLFSAALTLAMPAEVGPRLLDRFGFIHALSLLVLVCIPLAIHAARRGNVVRHRACMVGVFFGGVVTAGTLALLPGRMLHEALFGAF